MQLYKFGLLVFRLQLPVYVARFFFENFRSTIVKTFDHLGDRSRIKKKIDNQEKIRNIFFNNYTPTRNYVMNMSFHPHLKIPTLAPT